VFLIIQNFLVNLMSLLFQYDFLLIFRISEGPERLPDDDKIRLKWKDLKETWRKCVNGSSRAKDAAVEVNKHKKLSSNILITISPFLLKGCEGTVEHAIPQ